MVKLTETEDRGVVARGWGQKRMGNYQKQTKATSPVSSRLTDGEAEAQPGEGTYTVGVSCVPGSLLLPKEAPPPQPAQPGGCTASEPDSKLPAGSLAHRPA